MEPSFVQPGTIPTHDRADLNRSRIVHSLSGNTGGPEHLAAIAGIGLRVRKHSELTDVPISDEMASFSLLSCRIVAVVGIQERR